MSDLSLKIGSECVLELRNLKNSVTGASVEDATVLATITDRSGDEVSGETWPIALTHDTGGTYRVVLDNALSVVRNRRYLCTMTAVAGTGEKLTIKRDILAEYEDGAV